MKTPSNKILTIAVVLLLLVNIAMLIFMVKSRQHHFSKNDRGKDGPFEMMVKELSMTDLQKTDFNKLKDEHFAVIRPVFDSLRSLKKSMFSLVKNESVTDSMVNKYSALISEQQAIADKLTINHFRKVRAMFSGDQQNKFDDFVQKMMQRRMSGSGNRYSDSSRKGK